MPNGREHELFYRQMEAVGVKHVARLKPSVVRLGLRGYMVNKKSKIIDHLRF